MIRHLNNNQWMYNEILSSIKVTISKLFKLFLKYISDEKVFLIRIIGNIIGILPHITFSFLFHNRYIIGKYVDYLMPDAKADAV